LPDPTIMARTELPSDAPLTEVDMQAFADGNLPPERAARVRKYLGSRPGEADRIAFYRQLNRQMQHAFDGAAPHQDQEPRAARTRALRFLSRLRSFLSRRGVRSALGVAFLILATSGWIAAARVSQEALDACAVMALTQSANFRTPNPAVNAQHDPYAADLTPLGLKLESTRTRHPGALARIDEYDYRNADGEAVVLLAASAPFAWERSHWTAQRIGEVRLLTWTADGKRYVLAGHAKTHGLMRAADALTIQ
jgi:anti-sigma factor RsiW